MSTTVYVLACVAGGVTSVGVIWKKGVRPIAQAVTNIAKLLGLVQADHDRLAVVESQTRQLTNNSGTHLADRLDETGRDVTETRRIVEQHVAAWDEDRQALRDDLVAERASVRDALEKQATDVREALEAHANAVDAEFLKVWRELATRDVHKSADLLTDAAERAERALPRTEDPA